jgi:hypothetical protein
VQPERICCQWLSVWLPILGWLHCRKLAAWPSPCGKGRAVDTMCGTCSACQASSRDLSRQQRICDAQLHWCCPSVGSQSPWLESATLTMAGEWCHCRGPQVPAVPVSEYHASPYQPVPSFIAGLHSCLPLLCSCTAVRWGSTACMPSLPHCPDTCHSHYEVYSLHGTCELCCQVGE